MRDGSLILFLGLIGFAIFAISKKARTTTNPIEAFQNAVSGYGVTTDELNRAMKKFSDLTLKDRYDLMFVFWPTATELQKQLVVQHFIS